MNIFIINCHTANRGDEAAVRSLIDEINLLYSDVKIVISLRGKTVYPNLPENITVIEQYMNVGKLSKLKHFLLKCFHGNMFLMKRAKLFYSYAAKADLILHAPGGPSIGDIYYGDELTYLEYFEVFKVMKKPYAFYAPSMGPFDITERNDRRKKVLEGAIMIALRDPISADHVQRLVPNKKTYLTLDSALQHEINIDENEKKLNEYILLNSFLDKHAKVVGITITDLKWHPIYSETNETTNKIKDTFATFIKDLINHNYGVLFIPQLYGSGNDYDLMKSFMVNQTDCFTITAEESKYDAYFQQYIIGRLYAVIGMRYHSNIFSAKMGTPFVSISYEQKMKGFMEKINLMQYCLELEKMDAKNLSDKFMLLEKNHEDYKEYLKSIHNLMQQESYKTTELVKELLNK